MKNKVSSYLVITIALVSMFTCDWALADYCPAWATTCDEYISDVHVGAIHNTSTPCSSSGYMNYTSISTEMEIGKSYQIVVSNGNGYTGDQCGIWINWGPDEDFYDAGEAIPVTGGVWNFQAEITVPTGADLGQTRMRIRITYTGTVSPCGEPQYGEVEDYTIDVIEAGAYEVVHETATMGPFEQTWGYPFDSTEILGTRFHVDEQMEVATIGGHLVQDPCSAGTVFGAIVSLSGPTAFPAGIPFNSPDVMGSVVFELPKANMDFRVPLSVTLEPGDYAVVFGAGQFGADSGGGGLLPTDGQSWIPDTTLIFWLSSSGWRDYYPFYNPRFVVEKAVVPSTKIYGFKWKDVNDNGQMDPGEPYLSNWTIFIDDNYDGYLDPCEIFTTTDPNGYYEFTDIIPGEYYHISEVDKSGWINTYPGAGGTHYRLIAEEVGDEVEANFGNYQLHNCKISGHKFNDVNNNGAWDGGEGPLSGWEIYIDENENGQWDSGEPKTTTNGSGYYEFTNVAPGYHNIMEVPQSGWFQTFPGLTSGRLWGLEGEGMSGDKITSFAEINLDTMTVETRIAAPYPSSIVGGGCFCAGPSSLFYFPYKMAVDPIYSLFFEIDIETGVVIDDGVLDLPEDEIAWHSAWHNGMLYVISVETPLSPFPEPYLNRYDPFTKELLWRDQLDTDYDGLSGDPYKDFLLLNRYLDFAIYEVDPATGNIVDEVGQSRAVGVDMAYTNGVLYKVFWARDDDLHMVHREDGSLISTEILTDSVGFDALTGGVGTKGGHRFWIGKEDMVANFGNRLDSDASFSGIKYEDINGNGQQDPNELGLGGWTVYVDLDGDARFDVGEPSDVTDSDGIWTINGLSYGRYFVREVGRNDYTCTEPSLEWFCPVTFNGPRDIVFDDLRNLLYVSTADGNIERFDLGTNEFLSPVTLGGSPQGMDITADCGSLYVTNTTLSGGDGVVHKIDTSTLNVTDLTYSVGPSEDGSYDIAIGSEGIALFTGSYSGSSSLPLRVLDTNTDSNSISVRADVLGESTIGDDVRVIRSSDRSTLWLVDNSSSGWVGVYDSASDTFTGENDFGEALDASPVALNRDGSMAAVQLAEHCRIVDDDFNLVMGLDDSWMAAEFDPSKNWFYQYKGEWGIIFTIDTILWDILDYTRVGLIDDVTFTRFVKGETAITNDGRVLGITKPDAVDLRRSEYYPLALPGRVIGGLDFGNKPILCGDIDHDGDVDVVDLCYLSEDWLCSEVSMDIAPAVRDRFVNMPDFVRLANAWQSEKGDAAWDMVCDVYPAGGDDSVDSMDLVVLAEEWLMQGIRYDSDIAGVDGPDGVVDMYDFSCLAGNWNVDENIIEYDDDFETGDFTNLPWIHSGDVPWSIDASTSFEGTYSAKSGEVSGGNTTILEVTTECGAGNLLFMLKNGGEGTLRLHIDGIYVFDNSVGYLEYQNWFLAAVAISAGTHTFEWSYDPDGFGDYFAWIDGIRFPDLD